MYIFETGIRGSPTIVFLHGGGTAHWMWKYQVRDLFDYHLLIPDLPGHGKSSREKWVSFADTADEVAEIIREKAANGRAHVVGLSLGGYIVVSLLSRHPEVIDHAVVSGINALPYPGAWLVKGVTALTTPLLKLKPIVRRSLKAMKLTEEEQKLYIQSLQDLDMQSYLKISNQALDHRLPPMPDQMNVPALFVVGEKEVKNALASNPVLVKGVHGSVGKMVKGVGHAWVAEAPDLFSHMVRWWIEGQPLPEELVDL
jgi:pimeloyl-ACP methyl ester carboxylesterase